MSLDKDSIIRVGWGGRRGHGSQLRQDNRRMIHNYTSDSSVAVGYKNYNDDIIYGRSTKTNKNKKVIELTKAETKNPHFN